MSNVDSEPSSTPAESPTSSTTPASAPRPSQGLAKRFKERFEQEVREKAAQHRAQKHAPTRAATSFPSPPGQSTDPLDFALEVLDSDPEEEFRDLPDTLFARHPSGLPMWWPAFHNPYEARAWRARQTVEPASWIGWD